MEWKITHTQTPYPEAHSFMEQRVANIASNNADECVWLCEHPSLYTAGTSAKESDLLDKERFPIYHIGRGGEYTYHGPGQRIAYTMLNLKQRHGNLPDLRKYVRQLEQWIIDTLAEFDIQGERRQGRVGIWIQHENGKEDKIAAIGIRVRRWITFHGIAINLNPNLSHFGGIVPCGIKEHGVTSITALGKQVSQAELDQALQKKFQSIFE